MPPPRHKLLARQVRRLLPPEAAGPLGPFLDAVDAAYRQADDDHALLERSLELTSRELLEQNERLRAELRERTRVQEQLQHELAQRQAAEESLRRNVVRLDEAQRVAGLGYWEIDVRGGTVFWSDQTFRIYGFEPGQVTPSVELFARMVAPETFARITEAARAARPGEVYRTTVPITRADGQPRTLRVSGEMVRDENGRAVQIYGVCVDVTEAEEHEAELVRAKERAEEMLRLKSAFLDNMSHEIRTPLTGVIGYAELLADEVPDDYHDLVEAIIRGGRRLMNTLNAVLDLAQLESGTFRLTPAPVDVRAEVSEALVILRPLASQKGLDLVPVEGPSQAWALADRGALFRVLTSLIGNAIKFTERGHVEVAVDVEPRGGDGAPSRPAVRVRVSDTGPGIPPDFLPHLFEEFRQASDGHGRSHEGNGLGLAIAHRLVTLMGGTVAVESALGEGTTFEVALPLAAPPSWTRREPPPALGAPLLPKLPLPTAARWL